MKTKVEKKVVLELKYNGLGEFVESGMFDGICSKGLRDYWHIPQGTQKIWVEVSTTYIRGAFKMVKGPLSRRVTLVGSIYEEPEYILSEVRERIGMALGIDYVYGHEVVAYVKVYYEAEV